MTNGLWRTEETNAHALGRSLQTTVDAIFKQA